MKASHLGCHSERSLCFFIAKNLCIFFCLCSYRFPPLIFSASSVVKAFAFALRLPLVFFVSFAVCGLMLPLLLPIPAFALLSALCG
jgi:hypothetical protein